MAEARRVAANRANAARSTGPRTVAGRARAAANSRSHGATAALDADAVRAWFRLILDDPAAEPALLEPLEVRRAAFALAEAEARLLRARRAEEAHFLLLTERARRGESDLDPEDAIIVAEMIHDRRAPVTAARLARIRRRLQARESRLLARYRAEAESARRAALRRWIEAETAVEARSPETNP